MQWRNTRFDDPLVKDLRILLTNTFLTNYTGTECAIRDLALEFRRQGHEPMVFTPRPGAVAEEISSQGIAVVSDLAKLGQVPDIIHGQHHTQTMEALAHFPATPGIYVCHDATAHMDAPFNFPRILRYVAVDERCKSKIESVSEIPRDRITVIWNAVDLERFRPRDPLPVKPRTALVFSNYANWRTHLPAVRRACRKAGLHLDVLGWSARKPDPHPEQILPKYDIVFAKARCALEALAVGNSVVLCDAAGVGPMVSTATLDALRRKNFGHATLTNPIRSKHISEQIDCYDPADATRVSARIREEAGLAVAAPRWLDLYEQVIAEFHLMPQNSQAEMQA